MEFEDGSTEVLEGQRAEAWRTAVDRALVTAALGHLREKPGLPSPKMKRDGPALQLLLQLLEDLGESGTAVLLYLHQRAGRQGHTVAELAEDLRLDEDQVEEALEKLRGWGVVEEGDDPSADGWS